MQDIISETKRCEEFFPKLIDKNIYPKIELALKSFSAILPLIKESNLKILVIPSSLKLQELSLNPGFIRFLGEEVGNIRYAGEMMKGLGNAAAGAYHCYKVILLLDFVNVATIRHEIFHHIYKNLLNKKTKIEISVLFGRCLGNNLIVDKNQLHNIDEYFENPAI